MNFKEFLNEAMVQKLENIDDTLVGWSDWSQVVVIYFSNGNRKKIFAQDNSYDKVLAASLSKEQAKELVDKWTTSRTDTDWTVSFNPFEWPTLVKASGIRFTKYKKILDDPIAFLNKQPKKNIEDSGKRVYYTIKDPKALYMLELAYNHDFSDVKHADRFTVYKTKPYYGDSNPDINKIDALTPQK